jgi:hypothetical protein
MGTPSTEAGLVIYRDTAVRMFCTRNFRQRSHTNMSVPASSLPSCDSQPADHGVTSILELPGELRNRIYDFAIHQDEPIRITGPESYIDNTYNEMKSRTRLESSAKALPLHVLQTCRTVYHESGTRLFRNNSYIICKPALCHDISGNFIGLLGGPWVRNLGFQAQSIKELTIGLVSLCPQTCSVIYGVRYHAIITRHEHLLEVAPLMLAIWGGGLNMELEVIQSKSQPAFDRITGTYLIDKNTTLEDYECDTARIIRVLNALAQDQLGLQKYSRLLGDIGIMRSGNSGEIDWNTTINRHGYDIRQSVLPHDFGSIRDFRIDFVHVTNNETTQVQFSQHPKALAI